MEQKIQDLIEPETYVEIFNNSVEVPTNQYTTKTGKAWKLIKSNKKKLILGGIGLWLIMDK
jgi:hypothetical protein